MPGFLVTTGAVIKCPHGGTVKIVPSSPKVRSGQPVATMSSVSTVVGCPFQVVIGTVTKPQPCVRVQWIAPAVKVRVSGQPALVRTSSGTCFSAEQIPQGPPMIVMTQMKVRGT